MKFMEYAKDKDKERDKDKDKETPDKSKHPHDPNEPDDNEPTSPAQAREKAAKDATDKPTFTGKPETNIPDMPESTTPLALAWLQNSLVCDQNKKDFVFLIKNPDGYNGLVWHAICLKCGWQTYQQEKKAAIEYLLNYHLTIHIKEGARPIVPPLIGSVSETSAPSGLPYGPQPGQHSAGGDKPQTASRQTR